MKTIYQGKNVTNIYKVYDGKGEDGKFYVKPTMGIEKRENEWVDLATFDGVHTYNPVYFEDDKPVYQEGSAHFRVDLETWIVKFNKILSETDANKKECEQELVTLIKEYNKQMIEADERLTAYCKLHNLNIEEVDIDELKKVVYGKTYTFNPLLYTYTVPSSYCFTLSADGVVTTV